MGGWRYLLVRWRRTGAKQIPKEQIKPQCGALSHHQHQKFYVKGDKTKVGGMESILKYTGLEYWLAFIAKIEYS